jgi:hypothetical protein
MTSPDKTLLPYPHNFLVVGRLSDASRTCALHQSEPNNPTFNHFVLVEIFPPLAPFEAQCLPVITTPSLSNLALRSVNRVDGSLLVLNLGGESCSPTCAISASHVYVPENAVWSLKLSMLLSPNTSRQIAMVLSKFLASRPMLPIATWHAAVTLPNCAEDLLG